MLLFDAQPETLRTMVLERDQYLIPRRGGKILAGSTVTQDGFNKTPTTEARDRLTEFALKLLPAILETAWDGGLRPHN